MNNRLGNAVFCVEYFYAKPEYRDKLINALLELIEPTHAEPGCLQYEILQDKENPNLIIMLVKFINQETMTAHEQQPYVKNFSENYMTEYCEKVIWNDGKEIEQC